MRKLLFLTLTLFSALRANEDTESWFRETLKRRLEEADKYDLSEITSKTNEALKQSVPCNFSSNTRDDFNLFVFMTFDLPLSTWIEYSNDLNKVGGAFVVIGLPDDSFLKFAKVVKELKDQGVTAPIQLNPVLFDKFDIFMAPSIVLVDGDSYDKISGCVSLNYALEKFANFGDTKSASKLQNVLKQVKR